MKQFKITVDGTAYDVTVEEVEDEAPAKATRSHVLASAAIGHPPPPRQT